MENPTNKHMNAVKKRAKVYGRHLAFSEAKS